MYFPFLYGRRSEFLALRAMLSDHRPLDALVPVIEPVNREVGDLARCIEDFGKKGKALAVIFNPDKHQLKPASEARAWRKDITTVLNSHPSILPTFRCSSSSSAAQVDSFLNAFPGRKVALAYSSPSLSDAELTAYASKPDIAYHIVLNGKMSANQMGLLPKSSRVDLRDYFNKLERNSDYAGTELFTDRHNTFRSGWAGFGDYASIGSAFNAGGTKPAAVAIHAVFKHRSGDVWIEHFVSDDTDKDVGDTDSKFLQAARKLVRAAATRPSEFGKNFALDGYRQLVSRQHFPGLGANKVLQIQHHICLMLDVLRRIV